MGWWWLYQIHCTVWKWIFICLSWGWEICTHESFPDLDKCVTLLCWTCDVCEGSGLREQPVLEAGPASCPPWPAGDSGSARGLMCCARQPHTRAPSTLSPERRENRLMKDMVHSKSSSPIVPFTEIVRHTQMDSCHYNWGHKTFVTAHKSERQSVTL